MVAHDRTAKVRNFQFSYFTVKLGKRRSVWVDNEFERIRREVAENEELDFFDRYFEAEQKNDDDRRSSFEEEFQQLISSAPGLAWSEIELGFRKLILRYISECKGQAAYGYHINRLAKIYNNVKDAYEVLSRAE